MTKRKKIFLALSAIPILLITVIVVDNLIYGFIQRQSIPPYQKPETPSPLSVCEKIKDSSLKELCISKISNPDLKVDWKMLRPVYGDDGGAFYRGGGIKEYSEVSKNTESYCEEKEKEDHYSLSLDYCKATLVNPYWCNKMQPTLIGLFLFTDLRADPEECFHDIAALWQDPSFCKRTKDKDFCYLRVATEISNLK